ncbi:MAG: hypothetical protein Q8N53_02185 [Longimicrobiales bacterium]|nr:hypothetical protein [Longimicrobiales bacterium]
MSRHTPRCLALVLAAALAAPAYGVGQQTEKELVQHLDTLVPLLEGARRRAAAAQIARRMRQDASLPTDTVRVGLLTVLVVPGEGEAARDVVGAMWEREYAAWLDTSPNLEKDRIFFQWSADVVEVPFYSFNVRVVQGPRWRSRSYMEDGVRQVISQSLKGDLLGTRFGTDWTVDAVKGAGEPEPIYRRVALTPSAAARSCLEGDAASCLAAFRLVTDDTPLDEWYTPQERRLLVQLNRARLDWRLKEWNACAGGDTSECDRVLADFWERSPEEHHRLWAAPFGAEVRNSLLWYALSQGGTGAWGRLLAHAEDTPLATLEAASGMSGEDLMRGWHGWLLQNRPVRHAGTGSLTLGASFWMILLIALAARSTRCRLG